MNKKTEFYYYDPAFFLDDEEMMFTYLQDAMQEGDKEFIAALEAVSRSLGMTELAKKTGLSRETIYKTLNSVTKPQDENLQKIFAGLNSKMPLIPENVHS